jgi:anti-sigma regulatory factor (Ser/Thr protein kinase)
LPPAADHRAALPALRRPAVLTELPEMLAALRGAAAELPFSDERRNELELAVEEVLVNICSHAYPQGPSWVALTCSIAPEGLVVVIEDEGRPFSLPDAASADLTADIDDRPVGGLGILLVRTLTDAVRYRREDGRNHLELVFALPPATP